ncbi:MAG: hypothetical protein KatS3mg039_0020 [Candidatus Kapaibacterium sp.]|nr:MAG: hypothetical protein KatS3mg039_0020 [Candidatus Kapabacteria bacterium]
MLVARLQGSARPAMAQNYLWQAICGTGTMMRAWMQYSSLLLSGLLVLAGCVPAVRFRAATTPPPAASSSLALSTGQTMRGVASYYHDAFDGQLTASGEPFNQNRLTAAHPSLPFGTIVKVTNLQNQRSVVVRINDRGPFVSGRILDLSRAAAEQLGMIGTGLAQVEITIVTLPQ